MLSQSAYFHFPTLSVAMSTYEYKVLPQGRYIRLLHLQSGSGEDPLQCTLVTISLDTYGLEYKPISYAWGDSSKTQSIYCDGCALPVTESLHAALRTFRYTAGQRMLWADAVSINQENDEEKSSQVRIMQEVYRGVLER